MIIMNAMILFIQVTLFFMMKQHNQHFKDNRSLYKSIDVMLGALEHADYNQGLREAIKTLETMHNSQRDSQQENGKVDLRFSQQFTNPMTRVSDCDYLQISSKSLTDYLNRPEWSISGNPFPVSVKA